MAILSISLFLSEYINQKYIKVSESIIYSEIVAYFLKTRNHNILRSRAVFLKYEKA